MDICSLGVPPDCEGGAQGQGWLLEAIASCLARVRGYVSYKLHTSVPHCVVSDFT